MLKVGFANVDITPPLGTHKVGSLKDVVIQKILDPLFARIAVFDDGQGGQAAILQLDTLSIRWTTTDHIRDAISRAYGFPALNIMVAATHNHAGPAIATVGDVKRDDQYIDTLVAKVVKAFGKALKGLKPARLGFARCNDLSLTHNRRVVLRDGTVRTHGDLSDPNASHVEGPVDPEVGVLAIRSPKGKTRGVLVNFACKPAEPSDLEAASGDFPEAMISTLLEQGMEEALFLNGACGNVSPGNPYLGKKLSATDLGKALAADAAKALKSVKYSDDVTVSCTSIVIELPVRKPTPGEAKGRKKGMQCFIEPACYDRQMPALLERLGKEPYQPAEIQAIRLGPVTLVSIPAEYFTEYGLYIKLQTPKTNTLVVSCANGMLGYIPTELAFRHGGYETTLSPFSRMAPPAGKLLAENAITLINALQF
ncbi:MAG: hypothetical protein IJJ26_00590 [Victivallales bacterium]|nr:hypothetical protein [Victivallales bacterium]